MAIINCPECDKKISDKSEYCIGCGVPNDFFTTKNRTNGNFSENDSKKQKLSSNKLFRGLSNIVLFILFTLIQWFFIIYFSFEYIRVGPSGFIAFFGTLALVISYVLVRKIGFKHPTKKNTDSDTSLKSKKKLKYNEISYWKTLATTIYNYRSLKINYKFHFLLHTVLTISLIISELYFEVSFIEKIVSLILLNFYVYASMYYFNNKTSFKIDIGYIIVNILIILGIYYIHKLTFFSEFPSLSLVLIWIFWISFLARFIFLLFAIIHSYFIYIFNDVYSK